MNILINKDEPSHWRLWHVGIQKYVSWNDGRLRRFNKLQPCFIMENKLWGGAEFHPIIELHKIHDGKVSRSITVMSDSLEGRKRHMATKLSRKDNKQQV
jgi:hypothetical protein